MSIIIKHALAIVLLIINNNAASKEYAAKTGEKSEPVVGIATGKIQGRLLETVDNKKVYYGFQGIPYGQPPIGNLRFNEPLPAKSWDDILPTKVDGPRCIQFISTSGSEDCLNLNVFTPKMPNATQENTTDTLLPVMVWIYGGAFAKGASTVEHFSPDYLIDEEVIVVTFNYRVGVFGFLSTGDYASPGNWGLKDQILALKWIKENIVKFSGDPESVTLFGQSAGAACVSILVQSPLAKGLFHRAIMQSGTSLNQWSRARSARKSAFALGRLLNIKTEDSGVLVDQLRKVDNRTLQTTSTSTNIGETILHNPLDGVTFAPTLEVPHGGAVLTKLSHETLKNGDVNRIPVIVGFNSQEALPFIDVLKYLKPLIATYDVFATRLVPDSLNINRKMIKVLAASIIRIKYFCLAPIVFSTARLTQFVTEDQFTRPTYEYVKQLSKYSPTYFYIFSYEGPLGVDGKKRSQSGVGHMEVNKYLWNMDTNIKNPPANDVLTRKRLVRMWTNFAKTANPTPKSDAILQDITWSQSTTRAMIYLNISSNLELNVDVSQYSMNFWDRIFQIYGQPPMADDHHSSDESDVENQTEFAGVLSKWTNYIHGWQDRYIVLKSGTLSYYKSQHETVYGCRGALSLAKAVVKPHEFDECRFDVAVNDCVWYLRADTVEIKQSWLEALESFKIESGYGTGSETSLKRHGSSVSLQSNNQSTASGSSFKRSSRNLREKLAEIGTYKDILTRQIDTLQKYFDYCVSHDAKNESATKESVPVIDFKGEAITFKTTTAAVIDTLEHCAELVAQREESWRRRLEREKERRRQSEVLSQKYFEQLQKSRNVHPGPDLEEGPHSVLADDEFYDAVESGLDKMEEEQEFRERLKTGQIPVTPPPTSPAVLHRLWPEIDKTVKQQVTVARMGIGECGTGWQLFAEDGEMKMYRREEEIDGMVVDPLKAVHVVKGITGHEVCHYFFSPKYRYDWETTLEHMTVLENISDDTLLFLQTHKRIWPASQREAVFWSHMRKLPNDQDRDGPDIWTVVNNSTEDESHPANSGKCVRIYLTVCLLCQTRVHPPKDGTPITRDNVSCKITYCSVVNPGGWAPASVLRAVYKREYPKFLKRFTTYVTNQTKNKPIMF